MDEASKILVIILSAALAVFLILGITLLILLIKLTNQIKRTATSVRNTTESVENLVVTATKALSPALIGKAIKDWYDRLKSTKKEKDDE